MMLDEQKYLRDLLTDHFLLISRKNPRISWRAFAKKLNISSSSLSEIMSGKRKVSTKKALQIGEKLKLSEEETLHLTKLFQPKRGIRALKNVSNPFREKVLTKNEWSLHADWRYFAFVALMRTKDFRSDEKWIAERLGLSVDEIKKVATRLIKLGVVRMEPEGTLTETKYAFRTPTDYPDHLIRNRQIEGLKSASRAIKNHVPNQIGFFTTISLDPEKLSEAGGLMEDFAKRLSLFLHEGEPREVFELHLQLFPRTSLKK